MCVEFHPFASCFDEDWALRYDYFPRGEPLVWDEGVGDYVAESSDGLSRSRESATLPMFRNPHPSYEFPWGLSDVITALLDAGLVLRVLREYPFLNGWKKFHEMQKLPGRRWAPPDGMPTVPLMYGLVAESP